MQRGQQASSQDSDREGTLITENFGGLNTESAPNDLPDGDSPNMMNVEINTNGLLVKRRGTNWRVQHTAAGFRSGRGHTIMPHKLKKGHIVVCEKLQTGLRWGVLPVNPGAPNLKSGGITSIGLMANVFSTRAADSRASWVITPDDIPRLLVATGENTVVEVALFEQLITTTGASVGSMNINDDLLQVTRFHTVSGSTYTVLISDTGTVTPVTSTSRASKVITLNFTGTLAAGNYTVFRPVWGHWTEAVSFAPEQLYDYVVQPATGASAFPQLAIEIPEPLRRGATPFNFNGDRPYKMYNEVRTNPVLNTWNSTQTTATNDTEHVYSQGTGAQASGDTVQSGDTHVVFNRSAGSLPARLLHIVRFYPNPFQDGTTPAQGFEIGTVQNAYVSALSRFVPFSPHVDGDRPLVGNGQNWFGGNQYIRGMDNSFANVATGVFSTTGQATVYYFGMSGSYPFGINDGSMWMFNRKDYGGSTFLHIGTDRALQDNGYTGATNDVLRYGGNTYDYQGMVLPIAGLSEFCNFNSTGNYDFPSIISYYQGRVVLSGFKYSPNLVAMSNVTNNYEWFSSTASDLEVNRTFSTLYTDAGLGYNPLQVFLDVDTSERITNITVTNDALICFTQNNTVALTGVNGSNLIPTAYVQNRVSKVGCVNFKCSVNTELGVIFLSRSGVYFLKPVQETGAYSTINLSLKIQRIIDSSTFKNENVAWMSYDQAKSTVYVGLSDGSYDTCCTRLLVLNVLRSAWTEYGLTGGYWMSNDGAYIDSRMLIDFNIWADRTTAADNTGNTVNILELYGFHFKDWCFTDSGTNFTGAAYSTPIPNHTQYITLDSSQKNYSTTVAALPASSGAVRPIPLRSVLEQDFVNVTTVVRYTDWNGASGTGYDNTSTEVTGNFTTLQVDKTPFDGFVFSDAVSFATGNSLRVRYREYNAVVDNNFPLHVYVDNVELAQNATTGTPRFTINDVSGNTVYFIAVTGSFTANQIVEIGASIPCWWFSPLYERQQNNRLKKITHVTTQFRNRDNQLFKASDRNTAASQTASAVADKFKFKDNANVAILYDNTFDSTYQMDLFQLTSNLFDFGTDMNKTRRNPYARIVSPVIGSSFSLQMCIFSFDDSYFELSAYQMVTKPKGRSSRSSQDLR